MSQLSEYTWQCVSILKCKDSLPYGIPRIRSLHLRAIQLMISPGRQSGQTMRPPINPSVYTPLAQHPLQ